MSIPPHWLEQTVTANGIRQHFYRTGGEKPSLILLHGFSENGLCWSRVTTDGNEPWPGFTAWYNAWIAWHRELRTQTPEERVASSRQFLPPGVLDWPGEERFPFLEAQAQFNLDVLNYVPFVPTRTPWQETVQRIVCPILLLMGNPLRGAMVNPEEAEKIAATWYKGQYVSFAETGHMMHHELQGEQFDDLIQVVKAFLNQQSC